ncbi:MAG TPA: fumarylacetoacetate hydrolase family protein [Pirellulaceae bacterium]|nr:fumarylacetoacetate hydrolase family protein [Pirellulaceae bacterium]
MTRTYLLVVFLLATFAAPFSSAAEPAKYLRFQKGQTVAYGLLEGDHVRQLAGELFGNWTKTETTHALQDVKLLPPTKPSQVLALAGNYRSHLSSDTIPPKFAIPQPFHKGPSCLVGHGDAIVIPTDAQVVHYEAEIVVVIGKKCRQVSNEQAPDFIFGVTAGNDISERIWQNDMEVKDVQWWRAKGADTFGPVGPFIATGLDLSNLMLRLRLNGEVKQEEKSDHLIHDIPATVSFISQYITLHPGDLIFMGTPGKTSDIKPGDVVEVELEGVGVLRNPVVAEK